MRTITHAVPALVAAVALTVAACSDSPPASTSAPTPPPAAAAATAPASSTAASATPAGLIALGHSGMTGFNADPARPEQNAWDLSWATGDAPGVNSIATRLIAVRPNAKGLIWNAAGNGADVSALVGQAQLAFEYVPTPELVLVGVIDNDIRCDGTDVANMATFGAKLADALETITAQSPATTIVVFGYLGFLTPELVEQLVARSRSASERR